MCLFLRLSPTYLIIKDEIIYIVCCHDEGVLNRQSETMQGINAAIKPHWKI